ncbi:g5172 [Coccomyxa viridis]|uniref:G5172 protein n=1 Tax=Coccomyxa viridis TaxID=1274662 RepID=A0ABP1FS58_9CHLO
MRVVGFLLMAQCLLMSSSLGLAAARTLLQDQTTLSLPPIPTAEPIGTAPQTNVTGVAGNTTAPMQNSTAPPTSTPAPIPTSVPLPTTAMPATSASAPPTSTPAATPPPPAAVPYCTADIQPGTVWSNYDGTYMSVVNIYMVNYGSIDIPTPWTFSIMNPDYLEVFQTWNWESSGIDSAGKATGYANQYWQTVMASGRNQVNIGAIFKGSSPQNFYPRAITVNGQPCYIQQLR